jgi:hypothetical protein
MELGGGASGKISLIRVFMHYFSHILGRLYSVVFFHFTSDATFVVFQFSCCSSSAHAFNLVSSGTSIELRIFFFQFLILLLFPSCSLLYFRLLKYCQDLYIVIISLLLLNWFTFLLPLPLSILGLILRICGYFVSYMELCAMWTADTCPVLLILFSCW